MSETVSSRLLLVASDLKSGKQVPRNRLVEFFGLEGLEDVRGLFVCLGLADASGQDLTPVHSPPETLDVGLICEIEDYVLGCGEAKDYRLLIEELFYGGSSGEKDDVPREEEVDPEKLKKYVREFIGVEDEGE